MMARCLIRNKKCCEYEQNIKAKRVKQEELKRKQKERYDNICKHHKMLMDEIHAFENDYNSYVFSGFYYDGLKLFISELGRLLT